MFDALTPPLLAAMATARIGCLLAGCCYGKPTDLPWAVHFPTLTPEFGALGAHPTQLYWFLALAASATLLFSVLGRGAFRGQVALFGIAVFCVVKLSEQLLRYSQFPEARWPGAVAGVVLVVALVLAFALRPRAIRGGSASA